MKPEMLESDESRIIIPLLITCALTRTFTPFRMQSKTAAYRTVVADKHRQTMVTSLTHLQRVPLFPFSKVGCGLHIRRHQTS